MQKNKWSIPKLIVLVRNKPEEGILLFCKKAFSSTFSVADGPLADWSTDCVTNAYGMCGQCANRAAS